MATQIWKNADHAARWDGRGHPANPLRHEQLDLLLSIVADAYQPGKWVLDLGFGSGQVEALIFERIAEARVVGVDSSPAMMALAAERLARFRERYIAVEHDLTKMESLSLPDHPYQFVISVQALHHLEPEAMLAVYHSVYRLLEPGGLFLLLDRLKVDKAGLWPVYRSVWARLDREYGATIQTHEGASFEEHTRSLQEDGDLPVDLETHLRWFSDAGFEAACLHLHGNRALIVGHKASGGSSTR